MANIFDIDMIKAVYDRYPARVAAARKAVGKPLTLTEKILYAHLWDGEAKKAFSRGKDYVDFAPDRVAMQDATAQMALLQFSTTGRKKVAVPSTVHCDHLIQARVGAKQDLQEALLKSNEVFNFLESISNKYGIGFWKPGAGIIHQSRAGELRLPRRHDDRHRQPHGERRRPGHGGHRRGRRRRLRRDERHGLGTEMPKLIGVKLTGKLSGWTSPEGRDPESGRHPHREGRHRRHRGILRPRRQEP
jgi:aconitate hydratase